MYKIHAFYKELYTITLNILRHVNFNPKCLQKHLRKRYVVYPQYTIYNNGKRVDSKINVIGRLQTFLRPPSEPARDSLAESLIPEADCA
jgi:hypothetical protein